MNTGEIRRVSRELLRVEAARESNTARRIKAGPFVLGFSNLLFCGYWDQYLRSDPTPAALTNLFCLESSLVVILVIGYYIQHFKEIVVKTAVFPNPPASRLAFVLGGIIRRPMILVVWGTTSLFLIVFYRHTPFVMTAALAGFTVVLLEFLLIVCVLLLAVRRWRGIPVLAPVAVLGCVILLASAAVFHKTGLMAMVPVVSWAADVVASIQHAGSGSPIGPAAALSAALLLTAAVAPKVIST